MSLHTGDSSERSLRLSFVTITPSVFCASCSMNLWKQAKRNMKDFKAKGPGKEPKNLKKSLQRPTVVVSNT